MGKEKIVDFFSSEFMFYILLQRQKLKEKSNTINNKLLGLFQTALFLPINIVFQIFVQEYTNIFNPHPNMTFWPVNQLNIHLNFFSKY